MRYLERTATLLRELGESQAGPVEEAAELVAQAWRDGGRVLASDTNHVMHEELLFRSGGPLAAAMIQDTGTPVLQMTSEDVTDFEVTSLDNVGPDDVVFIHTNSGTNRRTVGTALLAQALGARTVGFSQMPYETSSEIEPWHASGKRLHEVVDVTIDLGGDVGDAAVAIDTLDVAVAPTSGATGIVAMWMIIARACELIAEEGRTPLVWQSIQCPGAIERNQRVVGVWQRTQRAFDEQGGAA